MTFNFRDVEGQLGGDFIMFRNVPLFIGTAREQMGAGSYFIFGQIEPGTLILGWL